MILQLDSEIEQKQLNPQKNCLHSSDFHHTSEKSPSINTGITNSNNYSLQMYMIIIAVGYKSLQSREWKCGGGEKMGKPPRTIFRSAFLDI